MPAAKKAKVTRNTKVADIAGAIAGRKMGKTIQLKAIRDGYYGVKGEIADVRKADTVFQFAVKDLVPVKDAKAFEDAQYADGSSRRSITIEGTLYELPSWCVDPHAAVEDDDEDEIEEETDDDAENTGGGSNESVI